MAFDGSVFVQRSIHRSAGDTAASPRGWSSSSSSCSWRHCARRSFPRSRFRSRSSPRSRVLGAFGYSVNTFTLLGLILAIGIVVDDAIIVHGERVPAPGGAGQGSRDRGDRRHARDHDRCHRDHDLAARGILAAALPHRRDGRLFNEFGVAVGGSVLISGVVALTLTPMLSAKILRVSASASRGSITSSASS